MSEANRRDILKYGLGALAIWNYAPVSAVAAAPATAPRLQRGINTWPWFSLTRELPPPATHYGDPPFQSQRPVPTRQDLVRLKAIGFDFIRLPVDPGPFAAASALQRKELMRSLRDAVSLALGSGLTVLVALMANGATHYWTPEHFYQSTNAPLFPAYLEVVSDIARMLSEFDQARVLLEPVNEPPQACTSDAWPQVQIALLQRARSVAKQLTLVATGSCGSLVQGLVTLDASSLTRFDPIIFTFHFYEPYLFTHQGAPWMQEPVYKALNNVPWPGSAGTLEQTLDSVRRRLALDGTRSPAEKEQAYRETVDKMTDYFRARPDASFFKTYLESVSAWASKNNVAKSRILMGEFGALRTDKRYVAASAADRARYIRDVRTAAETYGFPWAFWNLFDGFALMDEATRAFDPAMIEALGLVKSPN